uniref:Uncharacterized protein n=1 Tax=viral metagenome TaxID=1070528 RepID=A0A6M3KFN5_9ZZZZ
MALVDASTDRRIIAGWPETGIQITLAGDVSAGDPLMYSTGWKLSTNTSGAEAVLIAGETGASGATISAYAIALIELTHTLTNVPTMGELIAVADTGIYAPDAANTQDIGHIVEIDSDSLHSRALVWPGQVAYDTAGV